MWGRLALKVDFASESNQCDLVLLCLGLCLRRMRSSRGCGVREGPGVDPKLGAQAPLKASPEMGPRATHPSGFRKDTFPRVGVKEGSGSVGQGERGHAQPPACVRAVAHGGSPASCYQALSVPLVRPRRSFASLTTPSFCSPAGCSLALGSPGHLSHLSGGCHVLWAL